jgi:hypothetical protein
LFSFANVPLNDWPLLQSTETGMDGADACAAATEATETNKSETPSLILFMECPFALTEFRNAGPPPDEGLEKIQALPKSQPK